MIQHVCLKKIRGSHRSDVTCEAGQHTTVYHHCLPPATKQLTHEWHPSELSKCLATLINYPAFGSDPFWTLDIIPVLTMILAIDVRCLAEPGFWPGRDRPHRSLHATLSRVDSRHQWHQPWSSWVGLASWIMLDDLRGFHQNHAYKIVEALSSSTTIYIHYHL